MVVAGLAAISKDVPEAKIAFAGGSEDSGGNTPILNAGDMHDQSGKATS